MTPADFRAWRRRNGMGHADVLAMFHDLGWTKLSIRTVEQWGTRAVPEAVATTLVQYERSHIRDNTTIDVVTGDG